MPTLACPKTTGHRTAAIFSLALALLVLVDRSSATAAPPEVEQLIKQLSDSDETVRLKAAKELGKLKEKAKDAIPALTAATKDADEDVRTVAKKSLAAIKEAVGDKDAEKVNEKLAPLIKDLQSKDNKARLVAISQLEEMGAEAKGAGAALVEFGMMNANLKVQEAAVAAFEKIDPVIHKEVVTILVDQSLANRNKAVENLRVLGVRAKAALPAVKLYHNSLFQGLTQSGDKLLLRPGSRGFLASHTIKTMVAIAPDDLEVQRLILTLVGGTDEGLPRDPSGFRHDRPTVIAHMHTLKLENKQQYSALMSGLAASKSDRAIIIAELGKLGTDAKAALPVLLKLKTDKEAAVREAAAAAIEAIKD